VELLLILVVYLVLAPRFRLTAKSKANTQAQEERVPRPLLLSARRIYRDMQATGSLANFSSCERKWQTNKQNPQAQWRLF
jgi:hypothetical protein